MAAFQPLMTIAMAKNATPTMLRFVMPYAIRAGMAAAATAQKATQRHRRSPANLRASTRDARTIEITARKKLKLCI